MREPGISWRSERRAEGKVDVLVVAFELGVEIRISGELGLRNVHWETSPDVDAEAQRAEVARAVEWGRLHDSDVRARFRDPRGALRMGQAARHLVQEP